MENNLPVKIVAKSLRISCRSVYRLIADGHIPAFKVRNSLRIPEKAINDYLERQLQKYKDDNGISVTEDDRG